MKVPLAFRTSDHVPILINYMYTQGIEPKWDNTDKAFDRSQYKANEDHIT